MDREFTMGNEVSKGTENVAFTGGAESTENAEKVKIARSLMEGFAQFNRVNWEKCPIEGMRHSELVLLFCIKQAIFDGSPGVKVSEISNLLNVTSPTVTQLITSLEAKGYVERNADKEDRRAVRITLTPKAEKVIGEGFNRFIMVFLELVSYLGEEDSTKLVELLTKVRMFFHEVKKVNIRQGDEI